MVNIGLRISFTFTFFSLYTVLLRNSLLERCVITRNPAEPNISNFLTSTSHLWRDVERGMELKKMEKDTPHSELLQTRAEKYENDRETSNIYLEWCDKSYRGIHNLKVRFYMCCRTD